MSIFNNNNIELSNDARLIWEGQDKLTPSDVKAYINTYLKSSEFSLLNLYDNYYESENTFIKKKVHEKQLRDKTPNNMVPSSYYSTIVDTMAGFMFSNVVYSPKTEDDQDYSVIFNDILEENNKEVKEMKAGTYSLAFNKAIELVYTTGDKESPFEIKYTTIDPRQAIIIYDNNIEPDIFCLIWIRVKEQSSTHTTFLVDVIYKNEWQYYYTDKDMNVIPREEFKPLYFEECPVIVYNANQMSIRSPFHKTIPYINALDYLLTGNANDIEALTDAILVLTKALEKEDLQHLNDLKAITHVTKEDRVEYLTKDVDPAFKEYVSKLLIREIHKHSHTVDYFSPETGMSGEVSGKALRIRLFDMDSYSRKIEKTYKLGTLKKVRLLKHLIALKYKIDGDIEVVFNRTEPGAFEELAPVLNGLTFISDDTKLEMLGLDVDKEKERMELQKEANMERMELMQFEENNSDEGEDGTPGESGNE